MPPVDKPTTDPLILLLDEIEILSAQTRLMELYLKRAQPSAFGESEKIQEQLRAKVTDLKAKLEDRENSLSKHISDFQNEQSHLKIQNQDLLQRLAEQQHLIEQYENASGQRASEIVSLRERISSLESANQKLKNAAAVHVEQEQQELKTLITRLQTELAQRDQSLQRSQSAASQMEQSAQEKIRALAEELARSRESKEQVQGHVGREIEIFRQDAQAKISALQSEVAHKTARLTGNQTTITRLEQELKTSTEALQSEKASQQTLLQNHAREIQRRDFELASLQRRIAELDGLVGQQQLAGVDELDKLQQTYSADLEAVRSELREKHQLLAQGQGALQKIEQELRNRNRELQGQLAAKESVVESQEDQLRLVQAQVLSLRDALAEKERTLAETQKRADAQDQSLQAQRQEWQCQLSEKQLLVERFRAEADQTKVELARARQITESESSQLRSAMERQQQVLDDRNALHQRAQKLDAQVNDLQTQLNEKQAILDSQADILYQQETRSAEISTALAAAQKALEELETKTRGAEQDFERRFAELQAELERKDQALSAYHTAASRVEPELTAKNADLENRLVEKDLVLEARGREIAILQARIDSLSGQTARLETTHKQTLADAASETDRVRRELQAEIAASQLAREKQQTLLAEDQATFHNIEQELRGEIDTLKIQLTQHQTLAEKANAGLGQAKQDVNTLRERIAQLESAGHRVESNPADAAEFNASRIAALEQRLHSAEQRLAERETELQVLEQQLRSQTAEVRVDLAQHQGGSETERDQLKTAQDRIADLLERLSQMEAARHELQENAGQELQQLRAGFEARIEKMRMEIAAKELTPREQPIDITRLEEGFKAQIGELQGQLAEKHSLLENRNEELIRIKTEMDALQDHLAQHKSRLEQESMDARFSVELKEEDAVEVPEDLVNGETSGSDLASDPLSSRDAHPEAVTANGAVEANAAGAGRRWNMQIFKRRWKS